MSWLTGYHRLNIRYERKRIHFCAFLTLARRAHLLSNKPWDTAAGVLIAREAGAVVLDSAARRRSLDSPDTIAATPAIADQLMVLVNESIR